MIVKNVVSKELNRNHEMQKQYESKINKLPKGGIVKKGEYYYLQRRDGKKIISSYVGKDIQSIYYQIEKRKHFENMLKALKNEEKAIIKILESLT